MGGASFLYYYLIFYSGGGPSVPHTPLDGAEGPHTPLGGSFILTILLLWYVG